MKVNLARRDWDRITCSIRWEAEGLEYDREASRLMRIANEIDDQLPEYRPRKRVV